MASEIVAGISAFKTMLDLAKGLKDINDATTRNSVAIELQEKILSAQTEQAALIERISELEKQVAELEAWDADKQRYELTDFGSSTFAYGLKEGMEQGEPPHRLCVACYQKGQKSILQFNHKNNYKQDVYSCPACKTEFQFGERHRPQQPRVIRS